MDPATIGVALTAANTALNVAFKQDVKLNQWVKI